MAVVADRVVVELEAKLDRYNANLKRAEQNFAKSIGSQQRDIKQLEAQIARSSGGISNSLRGLAVTFAAAFSVRQIQEYADSYTRLVNQLRVAGVEGENLANVQGQLLEIANRNGIAVESLGVLYSRGAQVSRELGATQAELIQFSSGVAAALKIQGTSATEAQGALLQLSQALGSGTVRAEEFNSINEGALPILQAVARNMDAAGGSVARLKALVNDGQVSSEEFFRAFLAGTAQLEEQASNAALTIGGAFEVLNNQLGTYIGQADDSLSATERISAAIIALSENLETVTTALAVLGSVLLGRYVAGAVAAASATGVVSTAIFAMQARAIGAATTMEALALASATAGRAMLAAFGGPVGLAIAALSVGIYYLATRTDEATQAGEQYRAELETLATVQDRTRDATDRLAVATGRAREEALANARALQQETQQYLANAQAALAAARAKARQVAVENRERLQTATRSTVGAGSGYDPALGQIRRNNRRTEQAQANIDAAEEAVAGYEAELARIEEAIAAAPAVRNITAASPSSPSRRTPRDTTARDAEREAEEARRQERRALETQARVENEIAQLAVDRLRSIADLTGSANDRAVADMAALQADREAFDRAVALDEDLNDAQRAELSAARDAADAERARAIAVYRRQQLADERLARESDARGGEADLVRARGQANDRTARQRRETELRLIELQYEEERAQLEAIIASETSTELEKEIARAKLERLGELQALAQETARLRNQSPFEAYLRELNKSEAEINEDLEQIAVDGLDNLTDGITDAITGAKSLGEAFSDIADQIIADLIRIAIQQAIIKPLAELIGGGFGGGGGGGFGGGIGSFFASLFGGRASGGHVVGGNMYRVTDGEGFIPAGSGKIVPLGRMRTAAEAQGSVDAGPSISMPITVSAPGANEQTVVLIRQTIADAAPTIVQAAQKATMRSLQRKRMT